MKTSFKKTRMKRVVILLSALVCVSFLYACDPALTAEDWSIEKGYPSEIVLNASSITFPHDALEPFQLVATFKPGTATFTDLTWSSSYSTVASVNSSGLVTPLNAGTTRIKARTVNGKEAECSITVNAPPPPTPFRVITFDSGSFDSDCIRGGASNWVISTNTTTSSGPGSALSGSIGSNQESYMEFEIIVPSDKTRCTVTFDKYVSSETYYDYLALYCDSTELGRWSGVMLWSTSTYTVNLTPGSHRFRWTYRKNGSTNSGFDAAWVDEIRFYLSE